MRNKFFAVAFMLIGTFALASIDNSSSDHKEAVRCTSTTTTTTTTNSQGESTTTVTTNVSCDTPLELAQFQAELKKLTNQ